MEARTFANQVCPVSMQGIVNIDIVPVVLFLNDTESGTAAAQGSCVDVDTAFALND
jgi:hypothetical protein